MFFSLLLVSITEFHSLLLSFTSCERIRSSPLFLTSSLGVIRRQLSAPDQQLVIIIDRKRVLALCVYVLRVRQQHRNKKRWCIESLRRQLTTSEKKAVVHRVCMSRAAAAGEEERSVRYIFLSFPPDAHHSTDNTLQSL